MANGKVYNVVINEKALEAAAARSAVGAVNARAQQIYERVSAMSSGFRTGRFYDRTAKELRGGKSPVYGVKRAMSRENPHAIVHTANYAAMRFELDNNALLKASR